MSKISTQVNQSITVGKGRLLFKESGRNAYLGIHEVDDFKFNTTVEKIEKNSSMSAVVVQIASINKSMKVNGSFSCCVPLLQILRIFGLSDSVADVSQGASTLAWADITLYLDAWQEVGYVELTGVKIRKKTGTVFTAAAIDDIVTSVAHGLLTDDTIYVSNSGGALPAGLVDGTLYYVKKINADTFNVALTAGGVNVDITDAGTGTHSFYIAYLENIDYELLPGSGHVYAIPGGDITDALACSITASYAAQTMKQMLAATQVGIEGDLKFYGEPTSGQKQDFFAYVKLTPEGDFSMIGEDIQKFQINFEVIRATDENGVDYYYKFRDRSGLSQTVVAV